MKPLPVGRAVSPGFCFYSESSCPANNESTRAARSIYTIPYPVSEFTPKYIWREQQNLLISGETVSHNTSPALARTSSLSTTSSQSSNIGWLPFPGTSSLPFRTSNSRVRSHQSTPTMSSGASPTDSYPISSTSPRENSQEISTLRTIDNSTSFRDSFVQELFVPVPGSAIRRKATGIEYNGGAFRSGPSHR
jgi:hypothetical protein